MSYLDTDLITLLVSRPFRAWHVVVSGVQNMFPFVVIGVCTCYAYAIQRRPRCVLKVKTVALRVEVRCQKLPFRETVQLCDVTRIVASACRVDRSKTYVAHSATTITDWCPYMVQGKIGGRPPLFANGCCLKNHGSPLLSLIHI